MTRLAPTPPAYCAACFNACGPQVRHVDFEAAYDGPVIPGTPEPVPVDDLVICEGCLAEAFNLLDPQHMRQTLVELEAIVEDLIADNEAKDKIIQGAKATISELVEHPVKAFPGKPKLIGVSPEVREKITQNRYKRRGTSPAPKNHRPDQRRRKEEEVAA